MANLNGTVLITGATGGIGQAIAREFAQRGARLILSGRRTDVLEPLATELGARTVAADLAVRADVERLAAEAGEVEILVANAALPATGRLLELSQAQLDTMLEVNLGSQIALTRLLAPKMVQRRSGHIVYISSLSGKAASPASSMYNATKFGLRGFSLALREDLHGSGVGVSVVLPGFISDAGMFHDSGTKLPKGVGTRTPEQVAAGVLRAVERNKAEVVVAPAGLRVGADIAGVAPGLASWFQRVGGGAKIATDLAAGQLGKRPQG
jgi:short-subunit dehydrogenase